MHSLTHAPQPMHLLWSTTTHPSALKMALSGQTFETVCVGAVITLLVHNLPERPLRVGIVQWKKLHMVPRDGRQLPGVGQLRTCEELRLLAGKIVPLFAGNLTGPASHTFCRIE